MDYETLLYEQDEHVVTLTYNRPDQLAAAAHRGLRARDGDDHHRPARERARASAFKEKRAPEWPNHGL